MGNRLIGAIYRFVCWLAAVATALLGAIILYDGLTGSVTARCRAVTLGIAAVLLLIRWGLVILERNLRWLMQHGMQNPDPEASQIAQRRVHGVLAVACGGLFALSCGGIVGVLARLRGGSSILG